MEALFSATTKASDTSGWTEVAAACLDAHSPLPDAQKARSHLRPVRPAQPRPANSGTIALGRRQQPAVLPGGRRQCAGVQQPAHRPLSSVRTAQPPFPNFIITR
uniref:Uncharacterized protein n=1 Tax=Aegilops tauschii TaxID=37682 RepID=M8C5R5_AEGTA